MKNVILIRHGKSSWNLPIKDIDRPINQKGIENSYKTASLSTVIVNNFTQIISSPAKRTLETSKIFKEVWKLKNDSISVVPELYTFNLSNLEEIVKSCLNEYQTLIIFGHNSAITDFVNKFGDIFVDNVPTSGFVSITFQTDNWKSINKGKTDKIIFPSHI
ncbi:SixA phosphatase family protein [Flavobacterium sp.]|uniref:SixA phosphatase family protein n=1 Tax=Flavobacterium sp. TaxID=239 RepID=UPI0037512BC7